MPAKRRAFTTDPENALGKRTKRQDSPCGANTMFFMPAHTVHAIRDKINIKYEYQAEDIQAILELRIEKIENIILLASADMNQGAVGNRVADVLKLYLEQLISQYDNLPDQHLIIPIETANHWVGIRIELTTRQPPKITYYNSLWHKNDMKLMTEICLDINTLEISHLKTKIPYNFANPQIDKFENCLQQTDKTSCGPFLIENIYRDLVRQYTDNPTTSALAAHIRQHHLNLLKEKNNFYYQKIKNQQDTEAMGRLRNNF